MRPSEIIFEVTEAAEEGEDWNDLNAMVRDAALCHFDDGEHATSDHTASRQSGGHRRM